MSLLARAERVLPGGVNSPVRAFRGVGGEPVFVRAAQGAWLEGEDGRRYVDYIGGYGPHILGHRHPAIVAAVAEALDRGTAFGAPTLAEVELAELILSALPAVEMVRLSENTIHYQALLKALGKQLSILNVALSEGRRG